MVNDYMQSDWIPIPPGATKVKFTAFVFNNDASCSLVFDVEEGEDG